MSQVAMFDYRSVCPLNIPMISFLVGQIMKKTLESSLNRHSADVDDIGGMVLEGPHWTSTMDLNSQVYYAEFLLAQWVLDSAPWNAYHSGLAFLNRDTGERCSSETLCAEYVKIEDWTWSSRANQNDVFIPKKGAEAEQHVWWSWWNPQVFGGSHHFFRFYETCINPLKTSWLVCFVHPEHLSYDIPMNPKNDSFLSLYELPFAIDISPSAPRFIDITTWIQYKTITSHRVYTLYSGYIPTYGGHRYL